MRECDSIKRHLHAAEPGQTIMQNWTQWQHEVLTFLQTDFEEVLRHLSLDDVDWVAWRKFYDEGRSPQAAVNRALERDL